MSFNKGGRPRGSRNRLTGDFMRALAADFAEHGEGTIKIVRMEKPVEYLRIISSLMPRELLLESTLSEFTDDQVDELIVKIRDHLLAARQDGAVAVEAIERKMVSNETH
jgi:hypothetical protein